LCHSSAVDSQFNVGLLAACELVCSNPFLPIRPALRINENCIQRDRRARNLGGVETHREFVDVLVVLADGADG
jgi:hypothetical protein